jgi:tetratricopeptide (TPR) repeat protein
MAAALLLVGRRLYRFEAGAASPDRAPVIADRALAIAACSACAILALASFPLRITLTAYPWLLLLAWIFAAAGGAGADEEPQQRVVVPARLWSAALCLLLAPVLAVHLRSLLQRLEASRIVRTTSEVAQLAMQSGAMAARPVLQANLAPLDRAASLDPLAVGVPLTTAGHYVLLGNPTAAIESYRRGLAIEPRAELYINLARALSMANRREEAVASADSAVVLNPFLADDAADLGLRPREPAEEERDEDGERRARGEDRERRRRRDGERRRQRRP